MKQYLRLLMGDIFLRAETFFFIEKPPNSVRQKRAIAISDDVKADDPTGDLKKFIDNQNKITESSVSHPDSEDSVDVDTSLPSYECGKCDKTFRRIYVKQQKQQH